MRVLFASSEVYPLVKTGGLADVSGALPAALGQLGLDMRIVLPGYPAALDMADGKRQVGSFGDPMGVGDDTHLISAKLPDSGVPIWLLDCPALFRRDGGPYQDASGQDYADNLLRFGLLSWATARLCTEDSPVKWRPQVLHGNDWQTGLAPAFLRAWDFADKPATVFTIHNLAYQGVFPKSSVPRLGLPWDFFQMDGLEFYDQLSFLKSGLFYSDLLTTVSPRYAREIQSASHGSGMDGLLAHRADDLHGILNGADYQVWSPDTDGFLTDRYKGSDFIKGKAANKVALQRDLGLDIAPDAPLMVVVSRINDLKGMDLVLAALPAILRQGGQVAVVGTGDKAMEAAFTEAAAASPGQVAVTVGYSEQLAHRLLAGGDMLLMPSRFEPCGLTQLYAFRYGTIPVVHGTGGLADTVVDATYDGLMTGTATGFSFEHANAGAFQWCLDRAIGLYHQPETWRKIQKAGIRQDFSWKRSAKSYHSLYLDLLSPSSAKRKKGEAQ